MRVAACMMPTIARIAAITAASGMSRVAGSILVAILTAAVIASMCQAEVVIEVPSEAVVRRPAIGGCSGRIIIAVGARRT